VVEVSLEQPGKPGEHPLGPLVALSEDRSNLTRLTAVGVLIGSAVILGVAWWTTPDPHGLGTHQRLGLAPCGFLYTTGLPCPTCGMTTAFAYMVRGHFLHALWAQPAGAVLAGFTALLAVVAMIVLITGRRLEVNWYRINPMRVLIGALVLFLGGWAFKITVVLLSRHSSMHGG
jgi:hypothetical protein